MTTTTAVFKPSHASIDAGTLQTGAFLKHFVMTTDSTLNCTIYWPIILEVLTYYNMQLFESLHYLLIQITARTGTGHLGCNPF